MTTTITSSIKSAFKHVKLIKNMDYFGVNLNFKFNKQEKYKSVFGGLIFIIYFAISLSYSILIFDNFIKRKTMNLVFNEGYRESAPEINFANYSVEFALGLTTGDASKFKLLYKYLDIAFTSTTMIKVNGTIFKAKTQIPFVPCQAHMFFNLVNSSYEALGIDNYFCPDINNVNVSGLFTEDKFAYFEFATSVKKEFFNNTEEVRKLLIENEIKANFFYLDTSVSVDNFDNPIQRYLNNKFITLDFGFYKKLNLDFMHFKWISDSNILFQENQSFDYIVLDSFQEYFSDLGQNRFEKSVRDFQFLSKIYVRSSTRTRFVKRMYTKITEYLAQVSSILSSTLLILYVVVSYLNLFKAQQSIMKKIMKFKENINLKNRGSILYLKSKFMQTCTTGEHNEKDKEKEKGIQYNILMNFILGTNLKFIKNEVKHQSHHLNKNASKTKIDEINFSGALLKLN